MGCWPCVCDSDGYQLGTRPRENSAYGRPSWRSFSRGKWTIGGLVDNVWSVAGDSSRLDVNQMAFQYFANYNLQKGWFLSMSPTITANWEVDSPNRWTVPVDGGVDRIMRLGFQPVNLSLQFYGNPVRPPGTSPWGMRMQIAFLYPKMPKK